MCRELEGWCLEAATNLLRMMMGKSVIFVSWVLLVVGNLSDFLLHEVRNSQMVHGRNISEFFIFFLGWILSTLG